MKVRAKTGLYYETVGIQLNKQERATLERAAQIADDARELARRVAGSDFEDDDTDLWLAEVEHNARAFAVDGFIILAENPALL
jgi:hypothetical protein